MHVLIDDIKDLTADIIARNYAAGQAVLWAKIATHLYLDFDLGGTKTGYDLLKIGFSHNLIPDFVKLVTHNPPGRKQMAGLLEEKGYSSSDGCIYRKL